jgi:hypothetical protein
MADAPVVNIGQHSPERIAYDLMVGILNAEKIKAEDRTRKMILDTYAECISAVRGKRNWTKK